MIIEEVVGKITAVPLLQQGRIEGISHGSAAHAYTSVPCRVLQHWAHAAPMIMA